MGKVKENYDVTGEIDYIAEDLVNAFTFDLVQPIAITGKAEVYDSDIDIKMSNGDQLNFTHKSSDIPNRPVVQRFTINVLREFKIESDDPANEMREIYKKYLKRKLRM
jgi:hypothetical protein